MSLTTVIICVVVLPALVARSSYDAGGYVGQVVVAAAVRASGLRRPRFGVTAAPSRRLATGITDQKPMTEPTGFIRRLRAGGWCLWSG